MMGQPGKCLHQGYDCVCGGVSLWELGLQELWGNPGHLFCMKMARKLRKSKLLIFERFPPPPTIFRISSGVFILSLQTWKMFPPPDRKGSVISYSSQVATFHLLPPFCPES